MRSVGIQDLTHSHYAKTLGKRQDSRDWMKLMHARLPETENAAQRPSAAAATVEAMSANDHEATVAALREAVLACRASDDWSNDDRRMIFDLVQASIARWVDDLVRSLHRATRAIEKTREHSGEPDEDMAEELESALTQIGSARDKIVSVIALVFGVPSLVPQKPGMKFEPKEGTVKGVLSKLGGDGEAQAGQVKKRLDALDDHVALSLRHQIIHALSPLAELAENCWFRRADLDEKGGIRAWSNSRLLPRGTLDQEDIKPETIWKWAVESAEEAIGLLVKAIDALTKLVVSVREIAPPQPVYVWPDGRIVFERPKSDWLERGLEESE